MKNILNPRFFGIVSCIVLWVNFAIGLTASWLAYDPQSPTYEHMFILLHLSCIGLISVVITIIAFFLFIKNNTTHWFSSMGFLIYSILEIVLAVIVLNVEEKKTRYYVEAAVIFVILFIFTHCVSIHINNIKEEERLRKEREIEILITRSQSMPFTGCVRIPLTSFFYATPKSSATRNEPGPSTRNY